MKTLALAFTALLILIAPVQRAQANVDVSIDFFYDALQPYGDWVYIDNYGYCWEPYPELVGDGWQPYTDGYWAHTDGGWTWMTDEPFGWATYHYGRWMMNAGRWCWVPGYDWAPAWVSWRQSNAHIGWAPLPPEAAWSMSIGFSTWTDSYYDIGPSYYSFVPYESFACRTSLRPFFMNRRNNMTYYDQSVNITNISYNNTVVNNIFVGGPDVNRMDRMGRDRVPRYSLRRDDEGMRRDWLNRDGDRDPRSLSRVDRGQLIVASPNIRRDDSPGLPSRVRERIAQPDIDRGWRTAGNSEQSSRLRSQREQESRNLPKNLPERRPVIATSTTPPPAVGRTLSSTERRSFGPGSSRSSAGETPRATPVEVRKATPADTAGQPPAPRTGSTPSDSRSRSRFGRPDALPIPGTGGSQRPDVSERGPSSSRNPSATAEGRPPMPGSTFKKADEVRPALPTSPFGSRSGIPQTSRPPETKPEVRPATPSRPSFTPPSSSRSSDPSSRPSFTPGTRPSLTPPEVRPATPSRPSFTPPSSSRSNEPSSRPSFTPTPRPSTPSFTPQQRPSFTPPPNSRSSAPQSRPSFTPTPRPSTPSFTPQQRPSTPQPSAPQSRPSFTPPPQRPSFTPQQRPSTPQPSAPSSGPSTGDPRGRRGRG
ncbi:DUF6600 domain-containing protein [Prosthecobacter sp.]|uniref:DUF6600 domain-containing protein n=1 Tax=Prosthecobacter sp. TaxID=1965333 RepID=UPI002AB7F7A1|nr:DUF6600 domain-containing protein [Prosthecobacter sp.]MDZ4403422.1 DUF6600 domain-containing protein [Prosthecobacter sp.]